MTLKEIHIPGAEMEVLVSMAAMGNYTLEELIGAAAWTLADQDERFKEYYLRKMWFQGSSALPRPQSQPQSFKAKIQLWHTVSVPGAIKRLLPKKGRDDFSSVQKLAAAIHFFTALPLDYRLDLAREYTASFHTDQEISDGPMSTRDSTLIRVE
jgi:hypothetical protein